MFTVEIFIPLTSNDAAVFTADHHAAFEARLVAIFGGFSLLPGTVIGAWSHEGAVFTDATRVYAVFVVSITDGDKVGEIVDFAKDHYSQINIAIRYLGLAEIL